MNTWLDTILNLQVFAFFALLVWLYFKDFRAAEREDAQPDKKRETK